MIHEIRPSHVAVLVPSVAHAARILSPLGFEIGPEEIWDGEGTKEVYVEKNRSNSLLLMEPVKAGSYRRALEKRGPGLHHLAIDVLDLDSYIESLSGSGWLLHTSSLKSAQQLRTVYLARPGFPALIEVQEKKELSAAPPFVTEVRLDFDPVHAKLLAPIGLASIVGPSTKTQLKLGSELVDLASLMA